MTSDKRWMLLLHGQQIIAAQHGCGQDDAPVNAFVDEYRNWQCPNCMAIYGAQVPFEKWSTPEQKRDDG